MAELVLGEDKRFPLRADGSIVGRHTDDGSFRPDVDLSDLEGGRTVSRQHARVYCRDGQWLLRVEPTTRNVTEVAGRPLVAGQEATLQDGDEIRLGKVAVFFQAGPAQSASPPEALAPGLIDATAELRGEDRNFALAALDGGQLSLGRHSDDGSYRPDVDLGDLPYGRTVSRRHGILYNRGDQWFLKVLADTTNPTVLDGRTLAQGQEVPLADGNRLQLGRVIVTFHSLKRIPSVGPEQIELIVEPAMLDVAAGSQREATVTVINHTGHVDWFRVELVGIPQAWYRIVLPDGTVGSPALVRLFHTAAHATPAPDAVAKLRVIYAPPRDSQSRAGPHPLVFSATTQGEPQMRRVTTGRLTIERFASFEMTMQPEAINKPKGEFIVDLHNAGNDLATVALAIDGTGLIYQSDREQVQIGNGAWDRIRVTAKTKRRHWLGTDRFYNFTVRAKAGEDEVTKRAQLSCPPRIPIWIQTAYQRVHTILLPILILLAVLGIAFAFARPADITDFKAEPPSVVAGNPTTLSWSVQRAVAVTIEPASGGEELAVPSGTLAVSPAPGATYKLTARNRVGLQTSRSINVEVTPAPQLPKIASFEASQGRLKKEGEAVTLRWQTDGATKVTIEPADEVPEPKPSGEAVVNPKTNNAVYKLVATNAAGSVEATKTIVIDPPQVVSFTANPEAVAAGNDVRLRWAAQGATKVTIKASKGEVVEGKQELELPATATDQTVKPLEETEYTLTASNAGGSDAKTVTIKVSSTRIAFFRAEPASIAKGESAMLTWKVEAATAVTIQPGVGAVAPEQTSTLVKPAADTEYTITATGADGKQVQAKAKVSVGLGAAKVDLFTAAPSAITKGEQVTLTYSAQNAKRIVIRTADGRVVRDAAVGEPSVTGSVVETPDKTTTYVITVSNDSGQVTQAASVEVRQPTPVPPPAPAPPAPAPPAPGS